MLLRTPEHWRAALGAIVCALGAAAVGHTAAAQSVSVRTGVEYARGDYGSGIDVSDVYVPVTVTYGRPRVGLRLTVPYIRAESFTGDTVSGLGDIIAGFTVFDVIRSDGGDFAIDFTGKIKLGTADADVGLGTGENDYSVQADLYKSLARATLAAALGYKVRGDPIGVALEDVWFGSLGGLFRISSATEYGVFLDLRQSSIPGAPDARELSAAVSKRTAGRWRVNFYVVKGFTDASPDWAAGMSGRASF